MLLPGARRDGLGDGGRDAAVQGAGHDVLGPQVLPTTSASATAAASFISSVMLVAPASIAPRKTPGKASTLLIWFGRSLRPVATTAACRAAIAGSTSGIGLASEKTIASSAIAAIDDSGTEPPESPR